MKAFTHIFLFYFAVLCLALLSGCSTIKYIPINTTTTVRDTVTITHTDTVLTFKADTVSAVTKDTVSVLSNEYATSTAVYSNQTLYHSLITYPRPVTISIPKVEKMRFRETVREVPVEVEVVKDKIPSWCWWSVGVNVLVILLEILKIALKLRV